MPGGAGARPGSPVGHWSFLTPGLSTLPAQFDPKTLVSGWIPGWGAYSGMKDVFGGRAGATRYTALAAVVQFVINSTLGKSSLMSAP